MAHGATVSQGHTHFRVRAPLAHGVDLCLFDGDSECRLPMDRDGDGWALSLAQDLTGAAYGYRAHGDWAPEQGLWFDPAKLLVDPYAVQLDRRFVQDPRLAHYGVDTAGVVPRALVAAPLAPVPPAPPMFAPGGLIYEVNVRGFTMLHPAVPDALRGTVAALAHPAVIAHLQTLHVGAVELMPITAWIDERHLPPLGLSNAWGYNPVAMMALDPRLCPGGVAELRDTVAALHGAGIGVLLDLVFNHSGESDIFGGVISLRGLDDTAYAKEPGGRLINDTGCGNTIDFSKPWVRNLATDTMRHFVQACGVDGFRFDLATVMARGPGFDPAAPIFAEIAACPVLADRVLVAEPWDVGPGGYQLGRFPPNWLEWNDRYRDDVRRFWRGDADVGLLATRIAGSADLFGPRCRSVNFLAAHDGFTLADTVAYAGKHNHANGEHNRDGHGENFSWNNGIEGASDDADVLSRRAADVRALLATLFASTGTILLTAGDEFGRSQFGNNNAYAQDNPITWVEWGARDVALEQFTADLARTRAKNLHLFNGFPQDGEWLSASGAPMTVADWEQPGAGAVAFRSEGYAIEINRKMRSVNWRFRQLPPPVPAL